MQRGITCVSRTHIKLHIPTHRSTSITEKLLSGMIIPRPSFFATSIGLLKPFFSKVSTVSSFPFASFCTMFPSLTIKSQIPLNQKKKYYFWGAHLLGENKRWYSGEMTPLTKNVTRLCSKFADALHPMLTHNKGLRGLWAHLLEFPDLQFLDKCNSPCLNCLQNQKCRKHHYHQSTILLHTLAQTSTLNVILVKSHLY